jgi:hypothetical protein
MKIYYIKIKQKKQNTIAGWAPVMETTAAEGSQCLIPGDVAGVICLLHVLQDLVHCPQDVASRTWIPWDPRDRGHTQIL